MKSPPGSAEDSFAIRFVYEKNGKQFEFSPSELPADLNTYTFKDRIDKLVRKGNAEPAIKGFSLISMSNVDSTEAILHEPGYSILYFTSPDENNEWRWRNNLETTLDLAVRDGIPVYAVTSEGEDLKKQFEKVKWNFPIFQLDFTAFRTAARANPEIYLIKKGTIENKWPLSRIDAAMKYIENLKQ
jgi:hypothetical protein